MKSFKLFLFLFCFVFTSLTSAQDKPTIKFEDLMISAEKDFQIVEDARILAEQYNLPHTIYLPEGIFIEAKGVENNRVVYTIINDLLHPFNNGESVFWEEIIARVDLSSARIHWSNKPTQNPGLGYNIQVLQDGNQNGFVPNFLMVLESTNDAVMTFNYNDGSLINPAFIPGGNPNLSTPIEPLLTPSATILVSDQLSDNIVEFDTLGNFTRILFGGNTAILDNCRGIELRPPNATVVAAIAGGANQDAIAEFDLVTGNHIGNFIAPNAAQLNGPWDIVFRTADCLVAGEASDNIVRYDLNGNYIGDFATALNFPEQLYETTSGNIIVAVFSTPSGLYIFDSNGTQLNYFSAVTGLRGAFQLGNGNYLVTNASGVHILDQNTGALLGTPVAGVGGRSAHEYDLSIVPVELTSFAADIINKCVVLNWTTATEINNSGFDVERSSDKLNFSKISFLPGFGTTTEPKTYSYTDESISNGIYYYRLKQIDYNGSFTYSDVVEVEVSLPIEFRLEQNYPNPFNPSTAIRFSIPVESKVSINIFNPVSQRIAEVINNYFSAGSHDVIFDAENLPSGIYFYKVDVAGSDGINYTSARKMMLIK